MKNLLTKALGIAGITALSLINSGCENEKDLLLNDMDLTQDTLIYIIKQRISLLEEYSNDKNIEYLKKRDSLKREYNQVKERYELKHKRIRQLFSTSD